MKKSKKVTIISIVVIAFVMGLLQIYHYCLNLSVELPQEVDQAVTECLETMIEPDEYLATFMPLHYDFATSAYHAFGYTEDAEMYLQDKKFKLNVYNVRGEVCAQCECDAGTQVRILSDSFYPDSLVKGVYHLQLTLIDENNNVLTTLLGWDDCIIYIK